MKHTLTCRFLNKTCPFTEKKPGYKGEVKERYPSVSFCTPCMLAELRLKV